MRSVRPSTSMTSSSRARATASEGGEGISEPLGSLKAPGAKRRTPSERRITAHFEYVAPGGGTTQRPYCQAQRAPVQSHSPSIQTASRFPGRVGTSSTRAGGGAFRTSSKAPTGCDENAGSGSPPPHASKNATGVVATCRKCSLARLLRVTGLAIDGDSSAPPSWSPRCFMRQVSCRSGAAKSPWWWVW